MAYEFHYTPTGTGVISGKEVLEQTEDAINDLSGQISGDVQTAIDTANNALNTANTASVDAQNAINTANTAYTAATNAQNTANTAQNTASNALTAAQNAQNDVNALGNRVTTAEGNITQNTNAITGLTTRMGTAEGNIGNLQTAVSNAQATANSAQQTAATARQQSYVFRYSSTALAPSSTNSNTLLDNTDNLKVGDKVIDSSGVLFSITAIDTANSTFTIGTALIDLAQDSDVVHKSGDETISGNKTFSSNVNVYNSDSTTDTANIILKNSKAERGSTTNTGEQNIFFLDKDNAQIGNIKCETDSNGYSNISIQCSDINDSSAGVQVRKTITGIVFRPTNDNQGWLGQNGRRWYNTYTSKINDLTPSSLSMPDIANKIDISSYITNLSNVGNEYTPSVNGWICIRSGNATKISVLDVATSIGNTSISNTATYLTLMTPCVANRKVFISIICTSLDFAYFIPCQGNV